MGTIAIYLLIYAAVVVVLLSAYLRAWRRTEKTLYSVDPFAKAMSAGITAVSILVSFSSGICLWIIKEYKVELSYLAPIVSAILIFLLSLAAGLYTFGSMATQEKDGHIEITATRNYGLPISLALQFYSIFLGIVFVIIFVFKFLINQPIKASDARSNSVKQYMIRTNLFFAATKSDITKEHEFTLRSVSELVGQGNINIEVVGYADSNGGDAYNLDLSRSRAENVGQFLIVNGISKDRVTIRYFGESNPVAPNDTPEGRQLNRRVVLRAD